MHGPTCIFWAKLTPFSLLRGCEGTPRSARPHAAPAWPLRRKPSGAGRDAAAPLAPPGPSASALPSASSNGTLLCGGLHGELYARPYNTAIPYNTVRSSHLRVPQLQPRGRAVQPARLAPGRHCHVDRTYQQTKLERGAASGIQHSPLDRKWQRCQQDYCVNPEGMAADCPRMPVAWRWGGRCGFVLVF